MLSAAPPDDLPATPRRRADLAVLAYRDLARRSEAELIARVLGGADPTAEIMRCGLDLARLPFWQRRTLGAAGLVREHGIPVERAVRLAALWELADRWYPDDRPTLTSPRDVLILLDAMRTERVERVVAILLDARHRLIRTETVAVGTVNASRLTPRDVLAPALTEGAAAIIVAHNHPSGDPAPSRSDRTVTAALRAAAAVVGIPVLDHLVIARLGHHSFREADGWERAGPE